MLDIWGRIDTGVTLLFIADVILGTGARIDTGVMLLIIAVDRR